MKSRVDVDIKGHITLFYLGFSYTMECFYNK